MKTLRAQSKYIIKTFKTEKTVPTVYTNSIVRFLYWIRHSVFPKNGKKQVYIRVSYGKKKDIYGKMSLFINEGKYNNAKDLIFAGETFAKQR